MPRGHRTTNDDERGDARDAVLPFEKAPGVRQRRLDHRRSLWTNFSGPTCKGHDEHFAVFPLYSRSATSYQPLTTE